MFQLGFRRPKDTMRRRPLPTALQLGYGVAAIGIVQVLDAKRLQHLTELSLVQAHARRYVLTVSRVLAAGGRLGRCRRCGNGKIEWISTPCPSCAQRRIARGGIIVAAPLDRFLARERRSRCAAG
jgi:hypothetical protein